MGRGDNRRTLKMRRRIGQKRKKEQQRKLQRAVAAQGNKAPPPLKTPAATKPKGDKVTIKRSGQRKTAAAAQAK